MTYEYGNRGYGVGNGNIQKNIYLNDGVRRKVVKEVPLTLVGY
jgi:hypothetical protein